jgi:hypothetical protein
VAFIDVTPCTPHFSPYGPSPIRSSPPASRSHRAASRLNPPPGPPGTTKSSSSVPPAITSFDPRSRSLASRTPCALSLLHHTPAAPCPASKSSVSWHPSAVATDPVQLSLHYSRFAFSLPSSQREAATSRQPPTITIVLCSTVSADPPWGQRFVRRTSQTFSVLSRFIPP